MVRKRRKKAAGSGEASLIFYSNIENFSAKFWSRFFRKLIQFVVFPGIEQKNIYVDRVKKRAGFVTNSRQVWIERKPKYK